MKRVPVRCRRMRWLALTIALALAPRPAAALQQPNGTTIPTPPTCTGNKPAGLAAVFACACTMPNVCNIGVPCVDQQHCDSGMNGTCETTLFHSFNDNTCIPSNLAGLDPIKEAAVLPETFHPSCPLTFTVVSRGMAMFGNAFGWYHAGNAPPASKDLHTMLDCKAAPGAQVVLDLAKEPAYKGGDIGFFLVTPEAHNMAGRCAAGDCCAQVARTESASGWIYYSQRSFNPDRNGNGASYIHLLVYNSHVQPRKFYFAWEDIFGGSDNEFTDLVTSVEGVECAGAGAKCDTGKKGICALGVTHCKDGQLQCVPLYTPDAERCDGLDNDCNGTIDDGAMCAMNDVCWNGECVPHCTQSEFSCATDYECDVKSGLCVDPTCANVMCPPDKICHKGACAGACDGIVCPHGQTCRLGNCFDPCKGVNCANNLVCAEGLCLPGCGRCDGLTCVLPLACDTMSGRCMDPSCANGCPAGTYCDKGACKDACDGAVCPRGQNCKNGECLLPLKGDAAVAQLPSPDLSMSPGDVESGLHGQRGGCGCTAGGAERTGSGAIVIALIAIAALVSLRRKRALDSRLPDRTMSV